MLKQGADHFQFTEEARDAAFEIYDPHQMVIWWLKAAQYIPERAFTGRGDVLDSQHSLEPQLLFSAGEVTHKHKAGIVLFTPGRGKKHDAGKKH